MPNCQEIVQLTPAPRAPRFPSLPVGTTHLNGETPMYRTKKLIALALAMDTLLLVTVLYLALR